MKFLMTINCILFSFCINAQILNVDYLRFDTTNIIQHRLQFKNDSTIVQQHGLGSLPIRTAFHYTKLQDTIIIFDFENGQDLYLLMENNLLVNHDKKLLYVNQNHPNRGYLITIINGEKLIMNPSKSTYANEEYHKEMSRYNLDLYNIRLIVGYDAYKNLGYDYIFGVMYYEAK